MIACSRMYDVTSAARAAWRELFERVASLAGTPLAVIDHAPPAPLESLWEREDMGCVFMCGWPFTRARPQLVAAPVPRAARYGGRPVYFTDFIVRRDRGYATLEDTFGGCLAWTVRGSHSGFNAPRYHLLAYRDARRPVLFPATEGPVVTPAGALDSVLEGRADVAPLDSYALDLIRAHEPQRVANIQVLASTAPAPIPPLVAARGSDPGRVRALREVLLAAADTNDLADALDTLQLAGFALPDASDYDVIAERDVAARACGFPYPG